MANPEIHVILPTDSHIISSFLRIAGSSLKSFRYFEKRTFEVLNNHVITCIAFDGEQPIGYGHLDKDGNKIWLGIAVAEQFKGMGIGKKIMSFLFEKAKENKIECINLSVDISNEPAISLYKTLGFVVSDQLNEQIFLMEYKTDSKC